MKLFRVCGQEALDAAMPVCVQPTPHSSAWTLTLDIDEDQALIQGEHHILWARLADNRWIVTTARLETLELNFEGLTVVALGRRDLFPGPGRPYVGFSPLPEATYLELSARALSLLAERRMGAVGLAPAYTAVALSWGRVRPNEQFIYDHRRPPPPSAGYIVDLVRRDHQYCRCSASNYEKWYLPHGPDRLTWPWDFRRVEAYVDRLLEWQPTRVAAGFSSYGFILEIDDQSGSWPLPSPALTSRVAGRLREINEAASASRQAPTPMAGPTPFGPLAAPDGDDLEEPQEQTNLGTIQEEAAAAEDHRENQNKNKNNDKDDE